MTFKNKKYVYIQIHVEKSFWIRGILEQRKIRPPILEVRNLMLSIIKYMVGF